MKFFKVVFNLDIFSFSDSKLTRYLIEPSLLKTIVSSIGRCGKPLEECL